MPYEYEEDPEGEIVHSRSDQLSTIAIIRSYNARYLSFGCPEDRWWPVPDYE